MNSLLGLWHSEVPNVQILIHRRSQKTEHEFFLILGTLRSAQYTISSTMVRHNYAMFKP
jgi:hypothetical protein